MTATTKAADIRTRAAAALAKAEREASVADALPAAAPREPRLIVAQRDEVWICYSPESWGEILATFDAYDVAPMFDVRDRGARSISRTERGEVLCECVAAIQADGRCRDYLSGFASASFVFFATLADGTPVRVKLDLDPVYYSRTPWHRDLAPTFRNCSKSGRKADAWTADAPGVFAHCASVVRYAGGAPMRGMDFHGHGFLMTRECLAEVVAFLADEPATADA